VNEFSSFKCNRISRKNFKIKNYNNIQFVFFILKGMVNRVLRPRPRKRGDSIFTAQKSGGLVSITDGVFARKTNSRRHLWANQKRSDASAAFAKTSVPHARRLSASHRSPPPPLPPITGTHRRRKVISGEAVAGTFSKGRAAIGRQPSLTVCTAAEAVVVLPYIFIGSRPATGARRPHAPVRWFPVTLPGRPVRRRASFTIITGRPRTSHHPTTLSPPQLS